jgi:uncharacterized protein (TIGR02099 family)
MRRLSAVLFNIFVVLLVVVAITVGICRFLFPYIDHYRSWFEDQASNATGQVIEIGAVHASWKTLHPTLQFDNVVVLDASATNELVHIPHLQVGVSVLKSLLQRRIVAESLNVSGVRLSIHQQQDRLLKINGIQIAVGTPSDTSAEKSLQSFFGWILQQGEISLDHIDIDWQGHNGVILSLTDVQLTLKRSLLNHQIIGLATLIQNTPTKFRFVIDLETDLLRKKFSSAKVYLHIKNMDVDPWMKKYYWQGLGITHGHLKDLQLWSYWKNDAFENIQSQFEFSTLNVFDAKNQQAINIESLSGNIAWQKNNNGWKIAGDHLNLNINQKNIAINEFTYQIVRDPQEINILQIDRINLVNIKKILSLFPFIASEQLEKIQLHNPTGELNNIILRRDQRNEQDATYSMAVDVENLSLVPMGKIPGIKNLNAHLKLASNSGSLQMSGNDLEIDLNGFFLEPVSLSNYQGAFEWLKTDDGWQIHAEQIKLRDDDSSSISDMTVFIFNDKELSPFISLEGAFSFRDTANIRKYIPITIFKPALSDWFDAAFIGYGKIDGQLLLHGPLSKFPYDHGDGRFQLIAQTKDMPFNYRAGWPEFSNLNANVFWDGRRLMIFSDDAEVSGVSAKNIHAEIANLAVPELHVTGAFLADSEQALNFVFQSPLDHTIGKKLKGFEMSGPLSLDLGLLIPFYENAPPLKVDGKVKFLSDGKLNLPAWKINLSELNGAFEFTEHSLTAEKITANWLDHAVTITMDTPPLGEYDAHIAVFATGTMSLNTLANNYALDYLDKIAGGNTSYSVNLNFLQKKGHSSSLISASTDLEGIESKLPPPLEKQKDSRTPLKVEVSFTEKDPHSFQLTANYNDKVSTRLQFIEDNRSLTSKAQWHFDRGEINLGSKSPPLGSAAGLRVTGNLPKLVWSEVDDWISFLGEQEGHLPSISSFTFDQVDLHVKLLEAFGFTLKDINVKAQPHNDTWKIDLINNNIAGWLILPGKNTHPSLEAEFDRLYLTGEERSESDFASVNPSELPPLDILLRDFQYGERKFGKMYFSTVPQKNGLRINRAFLTSQDFIINAKGLWQKLASGKAHSTLSGDFEVPNLGGALKDFQITHNIVDGSGKGAFSLSWSGPVYKPSFDKLDGNFSFNMRDGRIINISDSSQTEVGFGRVLNLLSLQSLPKRLMLDFSDLTVKGFIFNTLKADFDIIDGVASTDNLVLDGNIAEVELKGGLNFNQQSYNMLMTVTPYVTESVPIIATIAGGPIAGAAAWIAQKTFGGVIDNMSSSRYKVIGPWVDPDISKF